MNWAETVRLLNNSVVPWFFAGLLGTIQYTPISKEAVQNLAVLGHMNGDVTRNPESGIITSTNSATARLEDNSLVFQLSDVERLDKAIVRFGTGLDSRGFIVDESTIELNDSRNFASLDVTGATIRFTQDRLKHNLFADLLPTRVLSPKNQEVTNNRLLYFRSLFFPNISRFNEEYMFHFPNFQMQISTQDNKNFSNNENFSFVIDFDKMTFMINFISKDNSSPTFNLPIHFPKPEMKKEAILAVIKACLRTCIQWANNEGDFSLSLENWSKFNDVEKNGIAVICIDPAKAVSAGALGTTSSRFDQLPVHGLLFQPDPKARRFPLTGRAIPIRVSKFLK